MKFSVKLDPISTDIVAHCITLHIIAGPEEPVRGAIAPPPPLCFEWGFTRTFPRNQDATVTLKFEIISIKF